MRSDCPLNYALELFGDKWTLLVIRDMMFFNKRHYNEFLASEECIATNILADRLEMLEKENLVTKKKDPQHKQKIIYSLTQKGIDLLPIIIEIGIWSNTYGGDFLKAKADILLSDIKKDKQTGLQKMKEALKQTHLLPGL